MPDLEIEIGGRLFEVSCQDGQEHQLQAAAAMLDREVRPILESAGRMPEARFLLIAGLMLADRVVSNESRLRKAEARIAELEDQSRPEPEKIEVPVIPPQVPETLAEIAARAEALADRFDEKRAV